MHNISKVKRNKIAISSSEILRAARIAIDEICSHFISCSTNTGYTNSRVASISEMTAWQLPRWLKLGYKKAGIGSYQSIFSLNVCCHLQ